MVTGLHNPFSTESCALSITHQIKQLLLLIPLPSFQPPEDLDLNELGLMALYSEVHPTISYIVHYGINMIAPVYKLQVSQV